MKVTQIKALEYLEQAEEVLAQFLDEEMPGTLRHNQTNKELLGIVAQILQTEEKE